MKKIQYAVEVVFNIYGDPISYHPVNINSLKQSKDGNRFIFNDEVIFEKWDGKNCSSNPTTKIFIF